MSDHGEWRDCEPGTIAQMVSNLNGRRQKRQALSKLVSTAGVLTLIFITVVGLTWVNQGVAAPITCEDCGDMMSDYHAGRLSQTERQNVEQHLQKCSHCRDAYSNARQKQKVDTTHHEEPAGLATACP